MEDNWHILSLPKELQRVIFEMLPLRVLARSQQVCKQWNNEALASLKSLTINDSKINGQSFTSIVSKLSPQQFKHLKLGAEAFIWDLTPLSRITHLYSLDIHASPSLSASAFIDAIECLTNLRAVRISRSQIALHRALPALVKHLPKLTRLTLVCSDVERNDLKHVLQLTNLIQLNLECGYTSLDDDFIHTLATRLTKLDSLHLLKAHVSDSLTALSRLEMLTRLIVPHSFFGAQSPSCLSSKLLVIEAYFSDESLASLAAHCSNLTSLTIGLCTAATPVNNWSTTLTDASFDSITKLTNLSTLGVGFNPSEDVLLSLQQLDKLKYLAVPGMSTATAMEKLKSVMPNLEYVNSTFVVRTEDTADPYVKYYNHYKCDKTGPVKCLTSFSNKPCFAAAVENHIWIQDRNDSIICKGVVSDLIVSNSNEYILLCDKQGQYGCFSIESDDFTHYVDPVASSLTCLAIADNQRFIVAGTNKAELKLLNTLGQLKATIYLKRESDQDTRLEESVLRLYFKADRNVVIGLTEHGIFSWSFDADQIILDVFLKPTKRTLTASAYFRKLDLIAVGDSDGLVTLSSSESLEFTENFQCDAPIVALSTHPKQALLAIATDNEVIVWGITGGEFKLPHSALPIGTAKCTSIAWAKTGGILFVGYSDGTVVHLVKCEKNELEETAPEEEKLTDEERRHKCGEAIYAFALKLLQTTHKDTSLAGKLTGMLLEMDLLELEFMTKNDKWLSERLREALDILEKL